MQIKVNNISSGDQSVMQSGIRKGAYNSAFLKKLIKCNDKSTVIFKFLLRILNHFKVHSIPHYHVIDTRKLQNDVPLKVPPQ